jgi:catechol 2,3-dioxygenase-like lactoylglutathione lyase family enzyme
MMFDHVTLRVSDLGASERFYRLVLKTLGVEMAESLEWDDFALYPADAGRPATQGVHVGFVAPPRGDVDRFWRVGTDAEYQDDGPPGPRPQYRDDYYGGFLLDPDGNNVEVVNHNG